MYGSWEVIKASGSVFEQALVYRGTGETELAEIQVVHG